MTSDLTHKAVQSAIAHACRALGYETIEERRGPHWRADVFASGGGTNVAFEVQLSGQSLRRTVERQQLYARDGVSACWLFRKPLPKLLEERPDLPVFYVSKEGLGDLSVSLSGRNELPLDVFVQEFLEGRMRFCGQARTAPTQDVRIVFFEMPCWKCKEPNHVYYVEAALRASCNALISPEEGLWDSTSLQYRQEIVSAAIAFAVDHPELHLRVGQIKRRYSRTVGDSYQSFGCIRCDSIFGDWFVMEAQMEAVYGFRVVAETRQHLAFDSLELPLPHWCYPGEMAFCE